MRILDNLLSKCNYNRKRYDTGGIFANAGMNNQDKLEYILANRQKAIEAIGEPTNPYKNNGSLLSKENDGTIVSNMYIGKYVPKIYTVRYNGSGNSNTSDISSYKNAPPENYKVDNTPVTKERLEAKAEEALRKYGRTDISAKDLAELAEAQKIQEGHFVGSKSRNTNNFGNVGNTDDGSVRYYEDTDAGIEAYYDLILKHYLPKGKTVDDLLKQGGFVNERGNRYATAENYEERVKANRDKIRNKKQVGGIKEPATAQSFLETLLVDNGKKGIPPEQTYNAWKRLFIPQIGTETGTVPVIEKTSPLYKDNPYSRFSPSEFVINANNPSNVNKKNNNATNIRDYNAKPDPITKEYPFKKYPNVTASLKDYTTLISDKYLEGDLSDKNITALIQSGFRRPDVYKKEKNKEGKPKEIFFDSKPKEYTEKNKRVKESLDKRMMLPEMPIFADKPNWLKEKENYEKTYTVNDYANNGMYNTSIIVPKENVQVNDQIRNYYNRNVATNVLAKEMKANPRRKGESMEAYKVRLYTRKKEDGTTFSIDYLKNAVNQNNIYFK